MFIFDSFNSFHVPLTQPPIVCVCVCVCARVLTCVGLAVLYIYGHLQEPGRAD